MSHNEQLLLCVCVTTLIIIRCLPSLCVNNLLLLRQHLLFLPNLCTFTVKLKLNSSVTLSHHTSYTILLHRIYRCSHHHVNAWRERLLQCWSSGSGGSVIDWPPGSVSVNSKLQILILILIFNLRFEEI